MNLYFKVETGRERYFVHVFLLPQVSHLVLHCGHLFDSWAVLQGLKFAQTKLNGCWFWLSEMEEWISG